MADRDAYIVSACRTAIGEFLGGLSSIPAPELGSVVIREAVSRAGIKPEDVEEVLMGNVVQAGVGQAPARQAAIKAGIPNTVGATTVNKVCGSGLKAVMLAAQAIKAGDAACIVAGGMESMSTAPHYLFGLRNGVKFGNQQSSFGSKSSEFLLKQEVVQCIECVRGIGADPDRGHCAATPPGRCCW